jgi:hypothetical protein
LYKEERARKQTKKAIKCRDYSEIPYEYKINREYSTMWLLQKGAIRICQAKNELKIETKKGYLDLFDLEKEATFGRSVKTPFR